tara:strand:+ start:488 stop:739 length:252 start_codon:yes stop_codon:yes gene_type:complete
MSDRKKWIILEQTKFGSSVKDIWSVKFADLDEDKAFEKMVALRTLNENPDVFHYLVDMSYLWKKDEPLVLTDEVKDNQEELPF